MTKRKKIFTIVYTVLWMGVAIVLGLLRPQWTGDERTDGLITDTLVRLCVAAVFFLLLWLGGYDGVLRLRKMSVRELLWCLPSLLIALVNFPFFALLGGGASVDRAELIPLFALYCLSVSLMEESVFRGVVQGMVSENFKKTDPLAEGKTVLVSAAVFSLVHLVNLFTSDMGMTLFQTGYTFLIGFMLSTVLLKTKNLWYCVLIHALFDFGGLLVPMLGKGVAWDLPFWILTVLAGVLCAGHVLGYLYKSYLNKKNQNTEKEV